MKYYPICLDLKGKRCIVVGGGKIAERKVASLMGCGASIEIISPELSIRLEQWRQKGVFEHICRHYKDGDLEGACLVIAATDHQGVNRKVAREAQRRGILHNTVDVPELCDFIVPSTVERGNLIIAISTGGNSPALARKIRIHLEGQFGTEYEEYLRLLGMCRSYILKKKSLPPAEKKALFSRLIDSDLLRHCRDRNEGGVEQTLMDIFDGRITLKELPFAFSFTKRASEDRPS